jgi:hypothetical protein
MASPRPIRIRYLAFICIAACIVAGSLGCTAGVFGRLLYGNILVARNFVSVIPTEVGGGFGILSGLLAGLLWCRLVVPLSLRQVTGLRSAAGLAGLGAGAFAAVLLHSMLMLVERELRLNALAVGLGMATPAGLILGMIGGQLCRMAVTTERAFRPEHRSRRPIPFTGPLPAPDPMEQLDVRNCLHPRPNFRDEYDA